MAYEVTATRRRPKTFDEMAGQDFVVSTLKSSIQTGRIAHAYLFSGPRGCGKTSAARILARSLNCVEGPTASPCGTCANCQEIARGASMDVIEIDGASNTGVNDVRQIKDEVLFPPNSGKYKVYIIDEVHMLSNSAFNALLKTIEEPPPYIIFIFATTELHKVPATIKSRCQQFAFRLFPIEVIKKLLAEACAEMGVEAEDEALFWIAKESTGSMRDAYTLLDQVVSFSEGKLRSELIREKLGLVGLDAVNALAEACVRNDAAQALGMVDNILDRGVSIEQFVIDLAGYYRSLLLLKNGITRDSLLGYSPERFSSLVVQNLSPAQIERALTLLLALYRDLRFSVSPRFELEAMVSQLSWLTQWVSSGELRDAIHGVRGLLLIPSNHPRWGPAEEAPGSSRIGVDVRTGEIFRPGEIPHAATDGQADEGVGVGDDPFAPEVDLAQPGAFTETFRKFMAARGDQASVRPMATPASGAPPASTAQQQPAQPAKPASTAQQQPAPPPPSAQPSLSAIAPDRAKPVQAPAERAGDDTDGDSDDAIPEDDSAESTDPSAPAPYDPRALREELIKLLKKERGMLASALEKSMDWEWEGDRLTVPVRDRLTAEMLRKENAVLTLALRSLGGNDLSLEIAERVDRKSAEVSAATETELPMEAELVRRMFRGTIIKAK
jgi:DNA polymerase-3 subunit gamma/tau